MSLKDFLLIAAFTAAILVGMAVWADWVVRAAF